jgi:hypothetical protein
MKMPKNISENEINNIDENHSLIEFDNLENFDYKFDNYDNEKALMKYIKGIESLVRHSLEYKRYIRYLKDTQDLTNCAFFKKINIKDLEKTGIEFHHYPFNLYEIVYTVVNEQSNFLCDPVNTFMVCNEVMKLHYENKVGLVPLSKTLHQLAHNGEIFINFDSVFGDFKIFIEEYEDFINPDLLEAYNKLEELSDKHIETGNKNILAKKFQEILIKDRNVDYYEDPAKEKVV